VLLKVVLESFDITAAIKVKRRTFSTLGIEFKSWEALNVDTLSLIGSGIKICDYETTNILKLLSELLPGWSH
jgi:hypothetical protein